MAKAAAGRADASLHARIGQYILQTGEIPHWDLFAFTKPGQVWFAFEWLSEAIFGYAFNLASYKGLTLLAGTLIALYVTFQLKYTIWRGGQRPDRAPGDVGGGYGHVHPLLRTATPFHVAAVSDRYGDREYNRRHGGRLVWLLVPMTALWVNLHGGFAVFFALLGLRVIGCAIEARWSETFQLTKVGLTCAVASLCNPYGIALHLHIIETLRNPWIKANVTEFLSPDFRGEELMHFMTLLFAGSALRRAARAGAPDRRSAVGRFPGVCFVDLGTAFDDLCPGGGTVDGL